MPGCGELTHQAIKILALAPSTSFYLCDLLYQQLSKGENARDEMLGALNESLSTAADWAEGAAPSVAGTSSDAATSPRFDQRALAVSHLAAVIFTEESKMRTLARVKGLAAPALRMLQAWRDGRCPREPGCTEPAVPKWVDCTLLVLGQLGAMEPKPKPSAQGSDRGSAGAQLQDLQQALEQVDVTGTAGAADGRTPDVGAEPNGAAPAPQEPQAPPDPLDAALASLFDSWDLSCGMNEDALLQAAQLAMTALEKAKAWATDWTPPAEDETGNVTGRTVAQPDPRSTARAALQVLANLTKHRSVAECVLSARGHTLVLSLPASVFTTDLQPQPLVSTILRNLVEDAATLQAAMEAEIRSVLMRPSSSSAYGIGGNRSRAEEHTMALRLFFGSLGSVAMRDPRIFLEAVKAVCEVVPPASGNVARRISIRLKRSGDPPAQRPGESADMPGADAPPAATPIGGAAVPQATPLPAGQGSSPRAGGQPYFRQPRKASASLVAVVSALLDVLGKYTAPTEVEPIGASNGGGSAAQEGMAAPAASAADGGAAGDAAPTSAPAPKASSPVLSPAQHELALQCFSLRLLAELNLKYQQCVGVLLKRDTEAAAAPEGKTPAGMKSEARKDRRALPAAPQRLSVSGGLFDHILETHVALSVGSIGAGSTVSTADAACYFFVSMCIRSVEARRRIISRIARILTEEVAAAASGPKVTPPALPPKALFAETPYEAVCLHPHRVAAAIMVLSALLSGQRIPRMQLGSTPVTAELVRGMKAAGLVPALAQVVKLVDLEHKLAPRTTDSILRSLEMLTRAWPARRPPPTQAAAAGVAEEGALPTPAPAPVGVTPVAHPGDTEAGPAAMAAAEEVLDGMDRERRTHSRNMSECRSLLPFGFDCAAT